MRGLPRLVELPAGAFHWPQPLPPLFISRRLLSRPFSSHFRSSLHRNKSPLPVEKNNQQTNNLTFIFMQLQLTSIKQ
jgi:hypothetical protein